MSAALELARQSERFLQRTSTRPPRLGSRATLRAELGRLAYAAAVRGLRRLAIHGAAGVGSRSANATPNCVKLESLRMHCDLVRAIAVASRAAQVEV